MLTKASATKTTSTISKNGKSLESMTDPKQVLEFAEEVNLQIVDLKFVDFLGQWRHVSIPFDELTESSFEEGIGYDGSSIVGFQGIE